MRLWHMQYICQCEFTYRTRYIYFFPPACMHVMENLCVHVQQKSYMCYAHVEIPASWMCLWGIWLSTWPPQWDISTLSRTANTSVTIIVPCIRLFRSLIKLISPTCGWQTLHIGYSGIVWDLHSNHWREGPRLTVGVGGAHADGSYLHATHAIRKNLQIYNNLLTYKTIL